MDDHKLKQDASRGVRAKRIFEDELVKEAFAALEKAIDSAWKDSRAGDEKERYNAYLMHRLLTNFKQQFLVAMINGEVAKKKLLKVKDESRIVRIFT